MRGDTLVRAGENVVITKRKCLPMQQPFFKVGTHWVVVGGGDGYLKLQHTVRKQGWSKLSLKNFELQKISNEDVKNILREKKCEGFNEYLKKTLSPEEHNTIAYRPLTIEIITLDWAEKTRWAAIQHRLPYQKQSRRIKEIRNDYDKTQRDSFSICGEYEKNKHDILEWRKENHKIDDFKMYQSALHYCHKTFKDSKHHDFLANALCTLISIKCYQRIVQDAEDLMKGYFTHLKALNPMKIIYRDLRETMLEYFPKGTKFNHPDLDVCVNFLYNQIKGVGFEIY